MSENISVKIGSIFSEQRHIHIRPCHRVQNCNRRSQKYISWILCSGANSVWWISSSKKVNISILFAFKRKAEQGRVLPQWWSAFGKFSLVGFLCWRVPFSQPGGTAAADHPMKALFALTLQKEQGFQEVEVFHLVHLDYIIAIVLVEEDCKVWELVSHPSYPGRRASGRLRSPSQTLSFLLSFSWKANQQLSVTRKGGRVVIGKQVRVFWTQEEWPFSRTTQKYLYLYFCRNLYRLCCRPSPEKKATLCLLTNWIYLMLHHTHRAIVLDCTEAMKLLHLVRVGAPNSQDLIPHSSSHNSTKTWQLSVCVPAGLHFPWCQCLHHNPVGQVVNSNCSLVYWKCGSFIYVKVSNHDNDNYSRLPQKNEISPWFHSTPQIPTHSESLSFKRKDDHFKPFVFNLAFYISGTSHSKEVHM